jgi:cold shock CspA family protein
MGRLSSVTTCESATPSTRHTGKVKWFNVKNGYGFITPVNNEDNSGLESDIFVHHSFIVVNVAQYKYLVEGEYVDFTIKHSENSDHKYHATDVTGVARDMLLCETRFKSIDENRKRTRNDISLRTPKTVSPKTPRVQRKDDDEDDFEYPKQKRLVRQSSRQS